MTDGPSTKDILDQLLFPHIFRSFRMAIHPRKLTIAFMAVVAIGLLGWLMDLPTLNRDESGSGIFRLLYAQVSTNVHDAFFAIARLDIPGLISNLTEILLALGRTFNSHPLWSGIFFTLVLVILCLAGGAICRLAAFQLAAGERPGLMDSLRFGSRRFWHLFLSPIAPLILVVFIGLFCITLVALIGNLRYAELLVGLGMPVILVLGVCMTLLILGTIAGFGLVFPAVAYEDSDFFIALNNSFRYVFSRPWRYGFYCLAAAVYGMIVYYFIRIVVFGTLWTSYKFLQLGFLRDNEKLNKIWPQPTFVNLVGQDWSQVARNMSATEWVAQYLIYICCLAVLALLVAYCLSFYFTANTVIYALLRKLVDGTEISKVETERPQPATMQPQATGEKAAQEKQP